MLNRSVEGLQEQRGSIGPYWTNLLPRTDRENRVDRTLARLRAGCETFPCVCATLRVRLPVSARGSFSCCNKASLATAANGVDGLMPPLKNERECFSECFYFKTWFSHQLALGQDFSFRMLIVLKAKAAVLFYPDKALRRTRQNGKKEYPARNYT